MPPAYTGARYPLADLEVVLGSPSVAVLALRLGLDSWDDPRPVQHRPGYRQVFRLRARGLTERQADELATAAGMHPRRIWPAWGDERARNARDSRRAVYA